MKSLLKQLQPTYTDINGNAVYPGDSITNGNYDILVLTGEHTTEHIFNYYRDSGDKHIYAGSRRIIEERYVKVPKE